MNDTATLEQPTEPAADDGWTWAVVEIFGHRKHAGRTREEERFGAKMLRIDIPVKGDPAANGWETLYYGGNSIFSYALIDEVTALRANKPWEPPSRMRLPPPDYDADGPGDLPEQCDECGGVDSHEDHCSQAG